MKFPVLTALAMITCATTWCAAQSPTGAPQESDYYRITTFETPLGEVIEACGFQRMPDGSLAVCSRRGDIFRIADPDADQVGPEQFSVYARGLHEPLSLAWRDGWLYATQRPEVTRMRDTDGDGRADQFETVADGWGVSADYHEYAFGSKFDDEGNLAVALCLTGSFSSSVPYRGWAMKVTPQGETLPMTSGVRSPGGIGADAQGRWYYTDNQGPWNGTCGLKPLRQGKFVGHPGGFQWYDDAEPVMGPKPTEPESGSRMHLEAERIPELEMPTVWFPYNKMGKSASGITCDTTGGKFGPFQNQLFVADQSASTVMRVFLEEVNGHVQGACFPFRSGFASGNVGLELTANGSMFVGGTNRGWGSVGNAPFAIERLNWTGKVPFEILAMRLQADGFELEFTQPVDPETAIDPQGYDLQTYTYEYRSQYGSPEVDHTQPSIRSIEVSEDRRRVTLVVDGLQRGHVHEMVARKVRNANGMPLLHPQAYYTASYLVDEP
jgi:glucose/arabinose dehydrogenase